jgi:hypothetical protein
MFFSKRQREIAFNGLCISVVTLGIMLRVVVFLQNRNLIIDEANLVRNLHERNYVQLLTPLSYEQHAPVPFILISKWATSVFGAYEWAVRLYPLICGILALVLFYRLLRALNLTPAGIYSLLLLSSGMIFLRYATEFKQYSSDQFFTIALALAALKWQPGQIGKRKFVLLWLLTGSIAIWFSMPSVFVLAGIGCYFLTGILKPENKGWGLPLMLIFLIWISQFIADYLLFLKPSIGSAYLQQWHKEYFLVLAPASAAALQTDIACLSEFWSALGGHWVLSFVTNLILFVAGVYYLIRKQKRLTAVLVLPVLFLFLASGLHLYTLLPRVSSFCYPLILLVITYGWKQLLNVKWNKILVPLFGICCVITIVNFNCFRYFFQPLAFEWITQDLSWAGQRKVYSDKVYIHELALPQAAYYLHIKPDSNRWSAFKGLKSLSWNTNIDTLAQKQTGKAVFIFSWIEEGELNRLRHGLGNYMRFEDSIIHPDGRAYLTVRK